MKCKICKKREATVEFCESITDFAHGFINHICQQCYVEIIETEYKKIGKNLKKQKALLKVELNNNGGKHGN